jgi:hypothetical protein
MITISSLSLPEIIICNNGKPYHKQAPEIGDKEDDEFRDTVAEMLKKAPLNASNLKNNSATSNASKNNRNHEKCPHSRALKNKVAFSTRHNALLLDFL